MSKVFVVRLTYCPPKAENARPLSYYVTKAKCNGRSVCDVRYIRVRRGQWRCLEDCSAFAAEFDTLEAAKRVLKASAIKKALGTYQWKASILQDVTPGRRSLFQDRQLLEVWPKPNAIELLAEIA